MHKNSDNANNSDLGRFRYKRFEFLDLLAIALRMKSHLRLLRTTVVSVISLAMLNDHPISQAVVCQRSRGLSGQAVVCHGCQPFSLPAHTFICITHRVQRYHCSSISIGLSLLTYALTLSHKKEGTEKLFWSVFERAECRTKTLIPAEVTFNLLRYLS